MKNFSISNCFFITILFIFASITTIYANCDEAEKLYNEARQDFLKQPESAINKLRLATIKCRHETKYWKELAIDLYAYASNRENADIYLAEAMEKINFALQLDSSDGSLCYQKGLILYEKKCYWDAYDEALRARGLNESRSQSLIDLVKKQINVTKEVVGPNELLQADKINAKCSSVS